MRTRAAIIAGLLCACGSEIGDHCQTSADCSADGDRVCDRQLPGGYCTIEGCDRGSCPDEATCVRFFPVSSLTTPCSPHKTCPPCIDAEDAACASDEGCCASDEECLSDGFCAPKSAERRFCMRECGRDYHCRTDDGYVCRQTGMAGAELAQPPGDLESFDADEVGRFCGPRLDSR